MSGKGLTDKMDLLRFCQKGLFDFDGGNQLKNSPAAPIYHFQRISNVSPSWSGQSNREKKCYFAPDRHTNLHVLNGFDTGKYCYQF